MERKPAGTGILGQIGWVPERRLHVSPGNPCLGPIALALLIYALLTLVGY